MANTIEHPLELTWADSGQYKVNKPNINDCELVDLSYAVELQTKLEEKTESASMWAKKATDTAAERNKYFHELEEQKQLSASLAEALDDYLNAGHKEERAMAAEKAKIAYKLYYGIDYINRNERK
jgi:hypothetical protein